MKTKLRLVVLAWSGFLAPWAAQASQTDIPGPAGSGFFGTHVTVLPNGNFVVVDSSHDDGAVANVGAVRLYTSAGVLISTLTGSTAEDRVGGSGIKVLANGHYVVISQSWSDGVSLLVGALTWCDADTGIDGVVSASNSVVGSTAGDGNLIRVVPLTNGNYVAACPHWDRGAIVDAGMARLCDGTGLTTGAHSVLNALVGVQANDEIGYDDPVALTNGNYVVISPRWDNGTVTQVGAVTWVDGVLGLVSEVSAANSLVGSSASDLIGGTFNEPNMQGVVPLTNGHYVVRSKEWDRAGIVNAGAVTWCNGITGTVGVINNTNSLVGATLSDRVGDDGIVALSNGNYVVCSSLWNNGGLADAGAVTWGSGTGGISGEIASVNSLVGGAAGDDVGSGGATALSNGNYVAISPVWDGGGVATSIGAVTWCNGSTGRTGLVSTSNSLTGTNSSDQAGWGGVVALSNGHYVVSSPQCDNGAVNTAGAATWGSGTSGVTGTISTSNSLMGSTAVDQVSFSGITALTNGNYVVCSHRWNRGAFQDAGAATWCDGTGPTTGPLSFDNSLVGSVANDQVGSNGALALTNGHYVVSSPLWNRGGIVDAGAATWADGTTGITGFISSTNSFVGTAASDGVVAARAFPGGDYQAYSSQWDNGAMVNVGAAALGIGSVGLTGFISTVNSIPGTITSAAGNFSIAYEPLSQTLIVGHGPANKVSLFKYRPDIAVFDGPGVSGERQNNGAAYDFGMITPGSAPVVQTFTLKNLGRPAVTGISLSLAPGGDAGFTLGAPGSTSLDSAVTTTFTLSFASAVSDTMLTTTVLVSSNDPDEASFAIPVTVRSLTPIEDWRDFWFDTIANTGDAADLADPDNDGFMNLMEYALDSLPMETTAFENLLTFEIFEDRMTLYFYRRPGSEWLNWHVEGSNNLLPASWTSIASKLGADSWTNVPGAVVQDDFGFVSVADSELVSLTPRRFMRLRVTTAP